MTICDRCRVKPAYEKLDIKHTRYDICFDCMRVILNCIKGQDIR